MAQWLLCCAQAPLVPHGPEIRLPVGTISIFFTLQRRIRIHLHKLMYDRVSRICLFHFFFRD